MAIARVSVLEFDSAEALAFAQESHKKQRARVFPHMQMCLCIRTSPTSFVDISIYPSEEAAEANLEDRTKFHEEVLDLSRNCAAPLIAYYALKENTDGKQTNSRV